MFFLTTGIGLSLYWQSYLVRMLAISGAVLGTVHAMTLYFTDAKVGCGCGFAVKMFGAQWELLFAALKCIAICMGLRKQTQG